MGAQENKQVAEAAYAAFGNGDAAGAIVATVQVILDRRAAAV